MRLTHIASAGVVALAVLMLGCNKSNAPGGIQLGKGGSDKGVESVPLVDGGAAAGKFTRLTPDECGIDFYNDVIDEQSWLGNAVTQSGLAAADYDADGDVDVYMIGIETPNKLFRNDGGFRFTDVTGESGSGLDGGTSHGSGAVFADLDNDSDLDLYVCNKLEPNHLFVNDGSGKFTDEAGARGAEFGKCSVQAAIFDPELDGDLDIYIAAYSTGNLDPVTMNQLQEQFSTSGVIAAGYEDKVYVDPWGHVKVKPDQDVLLVNDGKGFFTDGTERAGLVSNSWSLQAQATDFTNDGWPDLYVASDFATPDRYFVNDGDGTFTERSEDMVRKTPLFGMGCDSGDVNGDGLIDIFIPDMLARDYKRAKKQSGDMWQWRWEFLYMSPQPQMRNMLQINRGGGWFSEAAQLCGVDASDWTWAVRIVDFNCDGLPELFTTTGMSRDAMDVDNTMRQQKMITAGLPMEDVVKDILQAPMYKVQNYLFSCTEPLKYKLVDDSWGMTEETFSAGVSVADFDGDGDRDVIVNNTKDQAYIYRNDLECGNRAVIHLRQEGSNAQAVGARVWAHCGENTYTDDVILSRGYATGEPSSIYLGLAEHQIIDELEVRWPDGTSQIEKGLAANMVHTVHKRRDLVRWEPQKKQPLFAQERLDWTQVEVDTQAIEFEKEPLLPMQQTQLGTGAGVCDFDHDGNVDLYLAGAVGQAGQLYRGSGKGRFDAVKDFAGACPKAAEEMAVLWFDANGDGREDLFVTSGGGEAEPGSELYQPKLYFNTDRGFQEKNLPSRRLSTGSACAADCDADGDLDLFLCGHVKQYSYSTFVPCEYWENDGEANFSSSLPSVFPGLNQGGQVTEAQFADFNGDGQPDLVLSRFWGAVEVWFNEAGKFTRCAPLTKVGWWRSLGIGDYDSDGDQDIIAGNLGNDTKYHPKEGAPVTLFANDFDGNGTRDLIEVKYRKDGQMLPGRGRSCSGYAIGYIPQKWPTWASFADATLEDVYGPGLGSAERFDAEELHSVLLLNNGGSSFAQSELPGTAQWAPAFGVAVGDYDCDGNLDAYLANNFSYGQPETGRWSTGYGVLLRGDGKGGFSDLWPEQSGVRLWEDCRSAIPADLNSDGNLDIFVSVSNGRPASLIADASQVKGQSLWLQLQGKGKNAYGIGAEISATLSSGRKLVRYVQCGSGYLGSYSGAQHLGIPEGDAVQSIEVRWPNGEVQSVAAQASGVVNVAQE